MRHPLGLFRRQEFEDIIGTLTPSSKSFKLQFHSLNILVCFTSCCRDYFISNEKCLWILRLIENTNG